MKSALFATVALMMGLTACAPLPEMSSQIGFSAALPATRWDHRPEADVWTQSMLDALKTDGALLLSSIPQDIDTYCPGYKEASTDDRAAFWVGMFSAIAKYESTWNPQAKGGGGRYLGLLQISPATARNVGCDSKGLLDGATNLDCAVRIAANRVPSSAVAGLTTDWGPMHDRSKRVEVAAWTSAQSYCQAAK